MIYILDLETVIAKIMLIRKDKGLPLVTNYGQIERYVEAVNSVTSARNVNIQFHLARNAKMEFETKNKSIFESNLAIVSVRKDFEDFVKLERMSKIYNAEALRAMEDEKILKNCGII